MNKGQNTESAASRRKRPGSRARKSPDLERHLDEVHELALGNRRELDIQFHRIALMQADLDRLLRATLTGALTPNEQIQIGAQGQGSQANDGPLGAVVSSVSSRIRP